MPSFNLPIATIPFYYVLALVPHVYSASLATKGDFSKLDNRSPKSSASLDAIKRRLTPREFAAFERSLSCHRNALENMPLFVAAIFAGLLAELQAGADVGLGTFCVGWMLARSLYTVNYLTVETVKWSYVRTVMYNVTTIWALVVIGRSAVALGK